MYHIHHNYALDAYNTMALSCTASQVVEFNSEKQIQEFLTTYDKTLPYFVLSGGSNVLLPAKLHACVLRPLLIGFDCIKETDEHAYIRVMAGENWHDFVMSCIDNAWYGLENLALIPGFVGACPVQNIGAYGVEVADFIDSVTAYNLETGEKKVFTTHECNFAYRDSFFKQNPNTWLITSIVFKLLKTPQLQLNYADVAEKAKFLAENSSSQEIQAKHLAQAIIATRQSKLPDPTVIANTGSFFKNPVISNEQFTNLQKQFMNMPHYPAGDNVKIAAGWLIDNAGLKGHTIGNVATHQQQALVVVNLAGRQQGDVKTTQEDIALFSDFIINAVDKKYNIQLSREPVWVHTDASVS